MGTGTRRKNEPWHFVLYSAGNSPKHESALRNLQEICRDALGSAFDIDIVDVTEEPERAREDQILAIPTVVRVRPQPERRVVGDLSQRRQVVLGLELPRTTEDALGT